MTNLRINLVVWFVLVAFSTAYGAERKDLLSLLEQKRYSTIEATIVSAAKAAENNPSQERVLNVYLDQFFTPRSSLEDMLKDWVAASETSYIPYLAKGIYFTSMGWNRRGFKYLSKTDRNQIDGMSLYFGKAYQDLARSLMIEPRQVHAQSYLIEILMNLNQGEEVERLLKNALAYRPESLTARWYYLTTLLPRWGGSIDKMAAFVQSTRPYYKRNAALKVLDGRVAAEFGDQSYFAGNYARAFQFYTDALKTGDHWYYNNKRAEVLFSMAKYQAAIDDFSKAIEQRPTYWRSYDQRGVIYYVTGLHDEAIRDLTVAIDHREGGARVLNVRGKSYLALKEYLKALGDFEEAVMLDPNDTDYQANRDRAKAYLHAN